MLCMIELEKICFAAIIFANNICWTLFAKFIICMFFKNGCYVWILFVFGVCLKIRRIIHKQIYKGTFGLVYV